MCSFVMFAYAAHSVSPPQQSRPYSLPFVVVALVRVLSSASVHPRATVVGWWVPLVPAIIVFISFSSSGMCSLLYRSAISVLIVSCVASHPSARGTSSRQWNRQFPSAGACTVRVCWGVGPSPASSLGYSGPNPRCVGWYSYCGVLLSCCQSRGSYSGPFLGTVRSYSGGSVWQLSFSPFFPCFSPFLVPPMTSTHTPGSRSARPPVFLEIPPFLSLYLLCAFRVFLISQWLPHALLGLILSPFFRLFAPFLRRVLRVCLPRVS